MGQSFKKLFGFMFTKEARIMMFGLGDAGKTTILYTLKLGKVITTNPTIGFNVETLEYKNISFTVWDFGAYDMVIPPNYRRNIDYKIHYCHNAHGHIFVVDSTSRDHVAEARDKLHEMMLKEILYKDAVLLVFANKQDLPGAMDVVEITNKLDLQSLGLQHWYAHGTSATSGEGLYEGLDWLSNNIADKLNHLMDYPSYIIPPIW